jgi:hypothetical protein
VTLNDTVVRPTGLVAEPGTGSRSRARNAVATVKSSLKAAPEQGRQAGRAVRSHPAPVAAVVSVVGAAVAVLIVRRRAAKARTARRAWLPGFARR